MIAKLCIIVTLVILSSAIYCQTAPDWLWAFNAGGTGLDAGYAITTDNIGNSYVTGIFYNTASFGSTRLVSSGISDVYVAKLDPDGNWLWATQAGGEDYDEGRGIAVDSFDNVYLTGWFGGTTTFGSTTLTSSGIWDIFVAKLDRNGNWLWAKKAGGKGNERGLSIALDSSANVCLTGYFEGTAAFGSTTLSSRGDSDAFIAKLDTNGNWLWAMNAGGANSDIGRDITVDSAGNMYLTGSFIDSATFGQFTYSGSGDKDIFVSKVDTEGNWLWTQIAGGTASESGDDVVVDNSGNVYLAGRFCGNPSFGSTQLINGSIDFSNIFVAKLDSSGGWLWAKGAGGADSDIGNALAVDNSGNVYLTGLFVGVAVLGSSTLTSVGDSDIFIAKLDTEGNWLWVKQAGGVSYDLGEGISLDSAANAYLTGYFYGSTNFGSTTFSSNGVADVFVAKLTAEGVFVADELIPSSTNNSYLSNAFPNPFYKGSYSIIKLAIPPQDSGIFTIYNLRGQVVQNQRLTSGSYEINFFGKDLAPGIYFYRLKTPSISEVKKLILLR